MAKKINVQKLEFELNKYSRWFQEENTEEDGSKRVSKKAGKERLKKKRQDRQEPSIQEEDKENLEFAGLSEFKVTTRLNHF